MKKKSFFKWLGYSPTRELTFLEKLLEEKQKMLNEYIQLSKDQHINNITLAESNRVLLKKIEEIAAAKGFSGPRIMSGGLRDLMDMILGDIHRTNEHVVVVLHETPEYRITHCSCNPHELFIMDKGSYINQDNLRESLCELPEIIKSTYGKHRDADGNGNGATLSANSVVLKKCSHGEYDSAIKHIVSIVNTVVGYGHDEFIKYTYSPKQQESSEAKPDHKPGGAF